MSRYDVSKFSPPPDQELICGICMHVLDMPQESPCRHVFCKVCIGKALNEKSKCPLCRAPLKESQLKDVLPLVQNMLNKLTMVCDNHENGCEELIPMERFIYHLASCNYVLVTCKFTDCKQSLLKLNQERHETQECIYRDIKCTKGCCLSIPWKDRENHKCMSALMTLKDELINKNKTLESKIEDLNSVISALNSKLQEYESKNSKNIGQKTNSNHDLPELSQSSDSDVRSNASLDFSVSSLESNVYDGYEPYYSDASLDAIDAVSTNHGVFVDFCPETDILSDNPEQEISEFDPRFFSTEVDENHERDSDWFNAQDPPPSPHFDSGDDVFHYDPELAASEQVETDELSPVEADHSIQVSVVMSVSGGSGESEGAGDGATSRKRLHRDSRSEASQNKRQCSEFNESYHEVGNDTSVRRSRRLQNIEPSPPNEIPYVEIPPSASYLLDRYANEVDSSDDESWSPSHYSQY